MSLFCKAKMSPSEDEKMETLLSMSTKELSKLEVMQRLAKKQMSQKEAGEILHLCTRQIKRLLKRYRKQGAEGLVSKHRGRKAANRLCESVKKKSLELLKTKYQGFGPTLAHEKLVEKDKLQLSVESVRKLMIEESLWKPRKLKKIVTHQLRERRACFGELVQIDGSPHDWFEGRQKPVFVGVHCDARRKLVATICGREHQLCSNGRRLLKRCSKPGPSTAINMAFFGSISQRWLHGRTFGRAMQGGYSNYLCQYAASQRARGTRQPDPPRPPAERNASAEDQHPRSWRCLPA
jgi:transposase